MATSLQTDATVVANGFKALADPWRLQVIEQLRHQELCVCDLCDRLAVAQSKLSFHLKTLKSANLLRSRQQGKWVYYSLNLSQFIWLEEYLADIRRFSQMLPPRICDDKSPI
ncbi:MAG: metalloregulator ArsR/SmtB family transcription factor [Cyanobacteria bacterium P01_H01_bin.119]